MFPASWGSLAVTSGPISGIPSPSNLGSSSGLETSVLHALFVKARIIGALPSWFNVYADFNFACWLASFAVLFLSSHFISLQFIFSKDIDHQDPTTFGTPFLASMPFLWNAEECQTRWVLRNRTELQDRRSCWSPREQGDKGDGPRAKSITSRPATTQQSNGQPRNLSQGPTKIGWFWNQFVDSSNFQNLAKSSGWPNRTHMICTCDTLAKAPHPQSFVGVRLHIWHPRFHAATGFCIRSRTTPCASRVKEAACSSSQNRVSVWRWPWETLHTGPIHRRFPWHGGLSFSFFGLGFDPNASFSSVATCDSVDSTVKQLVHKKRRLLLFAHSLSHLLLVPYAVSLASYRHVV